MLRTQLNPNQLKTGQALSDRSKIFTEADLMAYGAATWDWHRLHYDSAYAALKGLQGLPIDGQLFGAVFAREVMDWAGPKAFIQKMGLKMKSMAFAGEHLIIKGLICRIDDSTYNCVVQLEQQIICGDRLVALAMTEVRLDSSD